MTTTDTLIRKAAGEVLLQKASREETRYAAAQALRASRRRFDMKNVPISIRNQWARSHAFGR